MTYMFLPEQADNPLFKLRRSSEQEGGTVTRTEEELLRVVMQVGTLSVSLSFK